MWTKPDVDVHGSSPRITDSRFVCVLYSRQLAGCRSFLTVKLLFAQLLVRKVTGPQIRRILDRSATMEEAEGTFPVHYGLV